MQLFHAYMTNDRPGDYISYAPKFVTARGHSISISCAYKHMTHNLCFYDIEPEFTKLKINTPTL